MKHDGLCVALGAHVVRIQVKGYVVYALDSSYVHVVEGVAECLDLSYVHVVEDVVECQ